MVKREKQKNVGLRRGEPGKLRGALGVATVAMPVGVAVHWPAGLTRFNVVILPEAICRGCGQPIVSHITRSCMGCPAL
jgi:hypothetical protein